MSATGEESVVDTAMEEEDGGMTEIGDTKTTYKSFKKKYYKIKIKFDEAMRQSNELFIAEQNAIKTAKRLAQENDQILDLLYDINNSAQIPVDKRIDISASADVPALSPVPALVSDNDLATVADLKIPQGQAIYKEIQALLEEKKAANSAQKPTKSLAAMLSSATSNKAAAAGQAAPEFDLEDGQAAPHQYLTPDNLDDYLYDIDASLGTVPPLPPQFNQAPQQDLAFGNYHSPYNWLRRNQPHIFLQDGEGSEKSHGKPGALRGAGKRASIPAPSKPDAFEIVEEDGLGYDFALGGGPATKNKRKRDDDDNSGGYHPKSGRADGSTKKGKPGRKKKSEGSDEKATPTQPRKKRAKIPSPDPDAHPFGPLK